MSDARKSIVVDIVSDSKKFLSGFEEAIKAIEKTAKRTDILGGMQDEITELRNSINSIETALSGIKPKIDDSAIEHMQKQMDSLGGKIKTLRTDIKGIKLQVDTSTGQELVKLFNKISTEFNHIQEQAHIFKGLGIGLNTNNINSNIEEINKLKQSIEELTVIQNDLKSNSTAKFDNITTKEAQKQLDALINKYNKLIDSMSDDDIIKTGSLAKDIKALQKLLDKTIIPESELKDVLLSATDAIEDRISEIRSKISNLSSEINAEVSTFEVKDGKISVKLDLATTTAQLRKTVIQTLSEVQDSVGKEPLLVPLRFTSAYKTKVTDELDELDKIAQGMKNSKAKGEITKQVENLRKQILDRDFKLEFKTNLPELLNNVIKPDMSEIQKILREAKLYLYPELKLDTESEKSIKEQVEKICKGLKIDLGIDNLDIQSLLGEEEIKKLNEQLKKLQVNISPTIDLTDKDIEKINKNLVSKLDKLHIEIDTSKLQEGLKSAVDISLIDNWRSKFISAIDEVCVKIEKSFDKVSKGQFYDTMKGWSEADKIMRDYRRGSSDSHGINTLFEQNASGELERKAYANSKAGTISNAYVVDQFGSVSGEIKRQLKGLYQNVKNIGEIYDTTLHSHPVSNKEIINTDKVLRNSKAKSVIMSELYNNILLQLKNQKVDISDSKSQTTLQKLVQTIYNQILSENKGIKGQSFVQEFNQKIQGLLGNIFDNINVSNIALNSSDVFKILQKSIQGNEANFLKVGTYGQGSDLTFSSQDLLSYNTERINEGIKKLMIESAGKINELDLSTIDDRIVKAIIDEYQTKISETLSNSRAQYFTTNKDGTSTIDYSKRAEISNKLLSDIIEEQIAGFNKKNKTTYSTNASDYLKQYDIEALKLDPEDVVKEQQEINKLIQLLGEMSNSLTEINKKDFKLNTDGIDAITKQIQSLLEAIKELGTQFKTVDVANFNISIEPFERIITTLQEMFGTFEKAFNSTDSSKGELEDVSKLSKKLQDVIKKIKDKNELFEKEAKIVAKTIPEETEKIGKLVSALENVRRLLLDISETCKQLDFSNVNNLGQLNKLKPDKISTISTALSSLSEGINGLSLKDGNILEALQDILGKTNELRDLSSVLKASATQINAVKGNTKYQSAQNLLTGSEDVIRDFGIESLEKQDLSVLSTALKATSKGTIELTTLVQDLNGSFKEYILSTTNGIDFTTVKVEEGTNSVEKQALVWQQLHNIIAASSSPADVEFLDNQSQLWEDVTLAAEGYKNELGEIVSITRSVRKNVKGEALESFKITGASGNSVTIGAELEKVALKQGIKGTNNEVTKHNKEVISSYQKLQKELVDYYQLSEKQANGNITDKELKYLKQIEESWKRAINKKEEYLIQSGGNKDIEKQAKQTQDNFINNQSNNYSYAVDKYVQEAQKSIQKLQQGNYTDAFKEKLSEIQALIEKINSQPLDPLNPDDLAQVGKLKQMIEEVNLEKNLKSNQNANENSVLKLQRNIYTELSKNSAMSKQFKRELEQLANELDRMGANIPLDELSKLANRFTELQARIQKSKKTGKSFFDLITSKVKGMSASFIAQYFSLQDWIRYLRQGFETIKEYDTALTEMNKVSDESIQTLKEFQTESFKLANSIGTTASQIQKSTADFMRLGESLEEAKQSAQDANILFNVSEFGSIDEATDSLIAMSQAYSELEKIEIVDIMNEIGNNYSISTDGLASALQRSAATLKVAGNDIYEATALITAGNAVLQDAEAVGTGLKMISLRILGTEEAKEELASLGENVDDFVVQTKSKIDETVRNYTAVASNNFKGISVLDENGNYRSTYEILRDISKVYQEILEADKKAGTNRGQALLEVLAGKNRSNVAASILNSPELLESAYESAQNADGSAQKENEAYLESIQGHLDQIKNSWDNIWVSEKNRKFITDILDVIKGLLDVVNKLGGAKTVIFGGISLLAAFKTFKGEGKWGFKIVLIS